VAALSGPGLSHQGEVQEARVAPHDTSRGFFITVEGIDRSGKTTQVERLRAALLDRGLPVGYSGVPGGSLREPGGTPTGEAVREVLLHRHDVDPWAEALLYAAARAQLVRDVVAPSLAAGMIVLLDRYVDSSLAYQGHARGLGVERILELNDWATGGLLPDLTVLLRVDPDVAWGREGGAADRMERQGVAFQTLVAEGYDEVARRFAARVVAIDGAAPVDDVAAAVEALVVDRLAAGWEVPLVR
jgi:dTMP kinase